MKRSIILNLIGLTPVITLMIMTPLLIEASERGDSHETAQPWENVYEGKSKWRESDAWRQAYPYPPRPNWSRQERPRWPDAPATNRDQPAAGGGNVWEHSYHRTWRGGWYPSPYWPNGYSYPGYSPWPQPPVMPSPPSQRGYGGYPPQTWMEPPKQEDDFQAQHRNYFPPSPAIANPYYGWYGHPPFMPGGDASTRQSPSDWEDAGQADDKSVAEGRPGGAGMGTPGWTHERQRSAPANIPVPPAKMNEWKMGVPGWNSHEQGHNRVERSRPPFDPGTLPAMGAPSTTAAPSIPIPPQAPAWYHAIPSP